MSQKSKNVLFQLSGSIACYKACGLISKLVQNGFEVQTVATPWALEFIGRATLEGLTGKPVFTDLFEVSRAMDHISLAKWADLSLVCPATASTINKLAQGIAEDVIGTLFLSYDLKHKPYWVAPAMNQQMMRHPATQASLERLESWGVRILSPNAGHQACGDEGPGRLQEPDQMYSTVAAFFEASSSSRNFER
jgi:phosphopantothenoylcysteine decarboxylase/phosphopantothenate--cysteine ligase